MKKFIYIIFVLFFLTTTANAAIIKHEGWEDYSGVNPFSSTVEDPWWWKANTGTMYKYHEVVSTPTRAGNNALKYYIEYDSPAMNTHIETILQTGIEGTGAYNFMPGSEYWIAFSLYLPADYVAETDAYNSELHLQFKGLQDAGESDSLNPPISLMIVDSNYQLQIRADSRVLTDKANYERINSWILGSFLADRGKWTDWVFHVKFDYYADGRNGGFTDIYKDGVLYFSDTGGNAFNDAKGSFLALGTYKFSWGTNPTDAASRTIYIDEIRLGDSNSSFSEVSPANITETTNSYTILKTNSPPIIDGNLNEFTNANEIMITNSQGTTGIYKLMWDNNNLYISAEAIDSQLNADVTTRDGALYNDDSIELFFDTLNNKGTSLNSDDYKFFVNILNTQADSNAFNSGWNASFNSAVSVSGIVNDLNSDSGYTIEIAIPWANWGINPPSENNTFGFDVSMDDQNNSGSTIQTQWSNSDGGTSNNPDGWGEIIFSSEFVSPTSSCGNADSNIDGSVSITELINYITQWKSGDVSITELIAGIGEWKNGC